MFPRYHSRLKILYVLTYLVLMLALSKGMLASQKDLQEYFNTTDTKLVCQEILEKGELQVSEQERQSLYDRLSLINIIKSIFVS